MRQRKEIYQTIIFFLLLSLFFISLSPTRPFVFLRGIAERIIIPLQRSFYVNLGLSFHEQKQEIRKLQTQNAELLAQLVNLNTLKKDNQALRDQFAETSFNPQQLLSASIIGMQYTPGTEPTEIIIDKGTAQGLTEGQIVIYKNILIGRIVYVGTSSARVLLTTHERTSFSAKALKTDALGILKGKGNEMVFEQVQTSDVLENGDYVVTKGSMDENNNGYPPNIIVGKIHAVDKRPSALFQSALVSPILDIKTLSTVFILINRK